VEDSGIGIPKPVAAHLFQPFSQADASTTRRFGGTGLGLSICARLVSMLRGEIGVESEPGRGSTFRFTATFGEGVPGGAPAASRERLADMDVLVVDDNDTNRLILAEMLRSWGLRPALVDGGKAALAELERAAAAGRPYPLVLLDAMMPEVDGWAVVAGIRANDALPRPAILVLSSAGSAGDAASTTSGALAASSADDCRSGFRRSLAGRWAWRRCSSCGSRGLGSSVAPAPARAARPRREGVWPCRRRREPRSDRRRTRSSQAAARPGAPPARPPARPA